MRSGLKASELAAGGLIVFCVVACGAAGADGPDLGRLAQPIFGGALDPDHPEVMLLADRAGFLCTGTNILSSDGSGFLLTAAHCVTEEVPGGVVPLGAERLIVVPGADFARAEVAFPALAVHVEPDYDGGFAEDDIAVVRFATGQEPPPPALTPLRASEDQLAVEDAVLLIGFGQTEQGADNTARRSVSRQLAALDTEIVAYSQDDGSGACFGDSGGPGLVSAAGRERVALVISGGIEAAGEDACESGIGVSMRASAYEGFIQGAIEEELGVAFTAAPAPVRE